MFRVSSCPSSGATTTAVTASGLPSELGGSSAVGHGRASRPTVCSMSAAMVSVAVLIRTFSYGMRAGRGGTLKKTLRISWSIGATTYSYLRCIVYDKLLKPRQSFWITLYLPRRVFEVSLNIEFLLLFSTYSIHKNVSWGSAYLFQLIWQCIQTCCEVLSPIIHRGISFVLSFNSIHRLKKYVHATVFPLSLWPSCYSSLSMLALSISLHPLFSSFNATPNCVFHHLMFLTYFDILFLRNRVLERRFLIFPAGPVLTLSLIPQPAC
jgi:hypothetical protein